MMHRVENTRPQPNGKHKLYIANIVGVMTAVSVDKNVYRFSCAHEPTNEIDVYLKYKNSHDSIK